MSPPMTPRWPVAIAHDYLTQRGGAERVVLAMTRAFPAAPVITTLYEPAATFEGFEGVHVRPSPLNAIRRLRQDPRLALPLLPLAVSAERVDADVLLCSSSGWAHGYRTNGRKLVYCYSPARWLYQQRAYVGDNSRRGATALLGADAPALVTWDKRAALSATRYLAISTVVRDRIWSAYGIDAEVVPAPATFDASLGDSEAVEGLEPGFFLTASRPRTYKNTSAVVDAFERLPKERLVVVGGVAGVSDGNVTYLGWVSEPQLRWLYRQCAAVISASVEDFGLTPLEGYACGKPAVLLQHGGFLDTSVAGETCVYFEQPSALSIAEAVRRVRTHAFDSERLRQQFERYSETAFAATLKAHVESLRSSA